MLQGPHLDLERILLEPSLSIADNSESSARHKKLPAPTELARLIVFATGSFLAYSLGPDIIHGGPAILGFPYAVLLTGLLLINPGWRPLYLLLALCLSCLQHLYTGDLSWRVAGTFCCDVVQAVFAAWLLRRMIGSRLQLDRLSQLAAFLVVAVVTAPALSGLARAMGDTSPGQRIWEHSWQWLLANGLSTMIVTMPILCWATLRTNMRLGLPARYLEALIATVGLLVSVYFAFGKMALDPRHALAAASAPVTFLLWFATRFGLTGASTGIAVLGFSAIISAQYGHGLFLSDAPGDNLFGIQLFLFVISCPVLALSLLFEEGRRAQDELNRNYQQIRRRSARLLNGHDDERRFLSRELHDGVCQELTAVLLSLKVLKKQPEVRIRTQGEIESLMTRISRLSKRIQVLSEQLHPSMVEDVGLDAALTLLCRAHEAHYDTEVKFSSCSTEKIPLDLAVCLFTTAREALDNIARHANSASVTLDLRIDSTSVRLCVRDWGCGFDPAAVMGRSGLGIIRVAERLRLLKGKIRITSAPGEGTELMVEMPLNRVPPASAATIVPKTVQA
jgi:signal transduction histidine kinase